MKHYLLQPEIAGGLGRRTVVESEARRYTERQEAFVSSFHCELDGWLGDDLIESFPCFLVTEILGTVLAAEHLSGFELADVEVTSSKYYQQIHPGSTLPKFRWLQITGTPEEDDFWIENDQSLAVSDQAWRLLSKFQLQHCSVRQEAA